MSDERGPNITAWTFLTTAGLAAGLIGGLFVGMSLGELVNAMIVTGAVTCAVGSGLGIAQAFALRHRMKRPFLWILATAAGMGLGLAVGVVLVEQTGILLTGVRPNIARLTPAVRAASFVVVGLAAGIAAGWAQTLVLKRSGMRVSHWLAACGSGLAIALSVSSLLIDLIGFRIGSAPGFLLFVLASGLIFGSLTARPLRVRSFANHQAIERRE